MTDPGSTETTVSDPVSEKEMVEFLTRTAGLAVDSWVIEHQAELNGQVTAADLTRLIVHATVAHLVGQGLVIPAEDPPEWIPIAIPPHLLPPLAEAVAVAEYRRFRGH
jgi:hypothetical protein